MPWLVSLVSAIVGPILQQLVDAAISAFKQKIAQMELDSFVNSNADAFKAVRSAQTDEERFAALKSIQDLIKKL
jgi:hypothetical protein